MWRAYFETEDGTILVSQESFQEAEEAALFGHSCLSNPEAYKLEDPSGQLVDATQVNRDSGITVEED